MNSFPLLLITIALTFAASTRAFDWAFGNSSVWLSAGAYCDINTYLTRTYKGYSAGFVPTHVIEYKSRDVQGYVGYMPSQQSIYVVFRGSTSIKDWINNLDAILTSYPRCSGCEVHKGFYNAQHDVIDYIKSCVKSLQVQFPTYNVVVTGHSLGAAMATLTAIDLLDQVSTKLRLFNFGSPRIGNTKFAEFASNVLQDRNRNTHYKDIVPHVPMHERFTHISGEWYEDNQGVLHTCTGYEDPNCSYQWNLTNVDDHMHYLGLYLGCDAVSSD